MHNDYSLLSGMLVCKKCGARMFAKPRSGSKGQFDYICDNKLRGGVTVCGQKVADIEARFSCKDCCGEGAVIKKGKKVYHKAVLEEQ